MEIEKYNGENTQTIQEVLVDLRNTDFDLKISTKIKAHLNITFKKKFFLVEDLRKMFNVDIPVEIPNSTYGEIVDIGVTESLKKDQNRIAFCFHFDNFKYYSVWIEFQ